MPLSFSAPTPLEYFASLVHSDEHFPLLEAAVCLAQDEYPDLEPDPNRPPPPKDDGFDIPF